MSTLLLTISANKLVAFDLRPAQLFLYDDRIIFHSNVGIIGGEEAIVNYDQVAQVNQYKGLLFSKLEIINKGADDPIVISNIVNAKADKAKELIENQSRQISSQTDNNSSVVTTEN